MADAITFEEFPKIARLKRGCVITEKIDGTNAQVIITEAGEVGAASRSRLISPGDDNFGFAAWVKLHEDELRELGPGRHFGEWWGTGIQRGYHIPERRFSLFNVSRWGDSRPACCHVVPTLYNGEFTTDAVDDAIALLKKNGSAAAPGFMKPEGIVLYHVASRGLFKVTTEKDEAPKSAAA